MAEGTRSHELERRVMALMQEFEARQENLRKEAEQRNQKAMDEIKALLAGLSLQNMELASGKGLDGSASNQNVSSHKIRQSWVKMVALHLEGKTLQWHQGFIKVRGPIAYLDWGDYVEAITARFGSNAFEDPLADLRNLKQGETKKKLSKELNNLMTCLNDDGLFHVEGREATAYLYSVAGSSPINIRPYKYAAEQKDAIEDMIADMLKAGVIRNSTSPYITDLIGAVAYRLNLPSDAQIHNVFHVSQLKRALTPVTASPTLPPVSHIQDVYPQAILDLRMVKRHNATATQLLIYWQGFSPADASWEYADASWEYADELQARFPTFLEDKESDGRAHPHSTGVAAFEFYTKLEVSLDSTVHSHNENTSIQHGDTGITSSIPDHVNPQQPAKKPTRQWAAWTREEEESFFTALRQVGKNFEKITRRVQSKNKDQVRHYYRLVRRMNKLLGPGLCLDAKNSKDTNAAMLRWWSLLEKYSCKASKLHLKPRRFKIFIEALENQLLKDRKKNVRKRPSQVENVSPPVPSTVTSQNRASTHETRTVKLVLVDSQNLQRLGAGKGSLKRNVNIGVIRGNRGDSTAMKPARQRRKQGVVLSAAYKKWEKAAIAGVSLVADAAEHLERTATDKEIELTTIWQTNMKLKLQLFPIDDGTRRALEMRWTQDSIVSALDVYTSIGSPSVFRLRYGWFSNIELASVTLQAPSASSSIPGGNSIDMENEKRKTVDSITTSGLSTNDRSEKNMDLCKDQLSTGIKSHDYALSSTDVPNDLSGYIATGPRNNFDGSLDPAAKVSWHEKETGDRTNMKQSDAAGHLRLYNGTAYICWEWADSLTNISVGDLLSEVPHDVDPNCIELSIAQSSQCLQQIPFSCDSFDAAIAAHMSRHQNKIVSPSTVASHTFSIWDAEETCDAFSFQKNHALHQEIPTSIDAVSPGAGKQTNSMVSGAFVEGLPSGEGPVDYPAETEPMDDCSPDPLVVDNLTKDFTGLTDIYWPESLGPLDLDIPSSKYHSEEFILNDSLSGLNRLIASSLDAFQNCSFFGLDEKDSIPVVEARETSSFSDFKIGSGV
ncbi:hypothetical protein GH714_039032 [Hevea brasiliensis]|uniref:Uncharacterized protein n=1 Tax=Hevea brasiliensis TaxID=3981 RepID=A0A6A6KR21_HEVBR|nr:hypothetical protein GH714_039032 [Hevea brasiliensis]